MFVVIGHRVLARLLFAGFPVFLLSCSCTRNSFVGIDPMVVAVHSKRIGLVARDEAALAVFTFTNTSTSPRPYFLRGFKMSLQVLEYLEERPFPYTIFGIGGWGRGTAGCYLSTDDFISLRPLERFSAFNEDVRKIEGGIGKTISDKTLESGERVEFVAAKYRLTARYQFDRLAYIGLCSKSCQQHNDPEMPWNQAPEGPVEAHVEFRIQDPPTPPESRSNWGRSDRK
jgi:hypothetical protein